MFHPPNKDKGFTLIELLIVVAIIAILAAIAVPNFLEAQTRSKVSRVKSDMRTLATAIESYAVDYNRYPFDNTERIRRGINPAWEFGTLETFIPVTTPIAYVSSASVARDIFQEDFEYNPGLPGTFGYFIYVNFWPPGLVADVGNDGQSLTAEGITFNWIVSSHGPDREAAAINMGMPIDFFPITAAYDPTNGTISNGDIPRYQ